MVTEIFGRNTLTAAGVPSGSSAQCTCATDALAIGVALERLEYVLDRLSVGTLQRRQDLLGGKGRHAILQLGQFVGDIGGQQIASGRQHLAELHEDRSQVLQRQPQAFGARFRQIAPEGERARGRPQPAKPFVTEQ